MVETSDIKDERDGKERRAWYGWGVNGMKTFRRRIKERRISRVRGSVADRVEVVEVMDEQPPLALLGTLRWIIRPRGILLNETVLQQAWLDYGGCVVWKDVPEINEMTGCTKQ